MSGAPHSHVVSAAEIESLFNVALDAMSRGESAGAVVSFERVLALDPAHEEAAHGLIRALEDSGQIDEAVRLTHGLIAANPNDVLAVTRLSILYQHQGMIPEAEAAAAKAKILGWKIELRGETEASKQKTDL